MSSPRFLEQELHKRIETISRFSEGRLIAIRGSNVFGEICKFVIVAFRFSPSVLQAHGVQRYLFFDTEFIIALMNLSYKFTCKQKQIE